MPRLRKKAAIHSERRARKGDIARRAMSRRWCPIRSMWGEGASNGDGALAPSLLRELRGKRVAEGRRGWHERRRSEATRRDISDKASGRAAGDGSGATELRRRKGGNLPSALASAQRAPASEGARDRHRKAKTAQGASWSRAGRSRVRRNRARRPVRRTGRAPIRSDRSKERSWAVIGDDGRRPTNDRVEGMAHPGLPRMRWRWRAVRLRKGGRAEIARVAVCEARRASRPQDGEQAR